MEQTQTNDREKFPPEQLEVQIPKWLDQVKDEAITRFPDHDVEQEIWPLLEEAGVAFLKFAQGKTTGFSRDGFMMMVQSKLAHKGINWSAPVSAPVAEALATSVPEENLDSAAPSVLGICPCS
jgi:hypothetical protein